MQLLGASLARARGEEFFPVIAEHLGVALRPREVTICESAAARRARTLAVWRPDGGVQNYEYDLAGTPCARVYAGERLLVAVDTTEQPALPEHGDEVGSTAEGFAALCLHVGQSVRSEPVASNRTDDLLDILLQLIHELLVVQVSIAEVLVHRVARHHSGCDVSGALR